MTQKFTLIDGGQGEEAVEPEAEVADITPPHDVVGLAKDMLHEAPKAVAGFFVLVQPDGSLYYDGCGSKASDLLWALEKCKNNLMLGQ